MKIKLGFGFLETLARMLLGSLSVIGISAGAVLVLAYLTLGLAAIGVSIYGIYLAFSASIILGIICLFVEPSPFVFGLVMLFVGKNLPQMIMDWVNK